MAPGNEAEWARINEEEERQEAEFAASLTPSQRVVYGQKLSQQAVSLLVASVRAGDIDGSHHLRVNSRHGIVDVMRGGLPPLDFETVAERGVELDAGELEEIPGLDG